MKYLIPIFLLSLLPNSLVAQQNRVGLTCSAPNENPMIFNVDLGNESATYFNFAKNNWVDFLFVTVRLNELVLMPNMVTKSSYKSVRLDSSKGASKIHIDRTTLEWFTKLTIDFDDNGRERTGGCAVHDANEIADIAKREYDRLNNTRAF